MPDKVNYLKDPEIFWGNHRKTKEARNKRLAGLSFSEKVDITERLQTDYAILQVAREQFGLGEITNSETELSADYTFNQSDFL